ncbi:MAG TPA: hypothetical protein VK421_06520 [Pyrinomonadaceae bacterium]|nr:hypothetical protein [Pyrinomonadaceae bacterium]
MFTTAGSLRLALLVSASLLAPGAAAGARPKSRAQRGGEARARKPAAPLPNFGDYPARDSFDGRPAPVRLRTRRDRRYRTRLREGAAEGPNFAGRYTLVYWGCGTGCAEVAVVDAKTGLVYWPQQQYVDIPSGSERGGDPDDPYGRGYRLDSRLLVLTRSNYDREASYKAYFYAFDGGRFRLVREALLKRSPIEAEDAPPRGDPVDPRRHFQN